VDINIDTRLDTGLVGTWSFVSCVAKTSTGESSYPWGHESTGFLSYTADGYVFVTRMSASDFESYCGKYTIGDDNSVVHHIELCSMPTFVGTQQKRYFEINNNELQLTTEPVLAGNITHTAFLVWKRAC
jgi:hypothetical protein